MDFDSDTKDFCEYITNYRYIVHLYDLCIALQRALEGVRTNFPHHGKIGMKILPRQLFKPIGILAKNIISTYIDYA